MNVLLIVTSNKQTNKQTLDDWLTRTKGTGRLMRKAAGSTFADGTNPNDSLIEDVQDARQWPTECGRLPPFTNVEVCIPQCSAGYNGSSRWSSQRFTPDN